MQPLLVPHYRRSRGELIYLGNKFVTTTAAPAGDAGQDAAAFQNRRGNHDTWQQIDILVNIQRFKTSGVRQPE